MPFDTSVSNTVKDALVPDAPASTQKSNWLSLCGLSVCHLAELSSPLWKPFVDSWGFPTQKIKPPRKRAFFFPSSLWVFHLLLSLYCTGQEFQCKTERKAWERHLHLVPDLDLAALIMMFATGFLVEVFHQGKEAVPVYSQLAELLWMNAKLCQTLLHLLRWHGFPSLNWHSELTFECWINHAILCWGLHGQIPEGMLSGVFPLLVMSFSDFRVKGTHTRICKKVNQEGFLLHSSGRSCRAGTS